MTLIFVIAFTSLSWASVTLIAPNGGENIDSGSNYDVQWTSTPDATTFKLKYTLNNGVTWKSVPGTFTGTGTSWTAPMSTKNQTKCKMKVTGYNGSTKIGSDVSDSAFNIKVLDVTAPTLGQVLDAGSINNTVTWDTGTPASVSSAALSYSVDNGVTWTNIATISGNPGSYSWTVPQLGSTKNNSRLRVTLKNDAGTVVAKDTSDKFTINVSPKTNASFTGEFLGNFMTAEGITAATELFNMVPNGNGTLNYELIASSYGGSDSGTDTYTISSDGQITMPEEKGVLSQDNDVFILVNTGPIDFQSVSMGIKKSSGLTNSVLNGVYYVANMFTDSNGVWTRLLEVTFNGDGTGTSHCLSDTRGCVSDSAFSYTVASDGSYTNTTNGNTGVVSTDGRIFTAVDVDESDSELCIAVGVKKSSGGMSVSSLAGKFYAIDVGFDLIAARLHTEYNKVTFNGAGSLKWVELYTTWSPLITNTASYSVSSEGILTLGASSSIAGLVFPDGQGFMFIDTSSDEASIAVGIKAAK